MSNKLFVLYGAKDLALKPKNDVINNKRIGTLQWSGENFGSIFTVGWNGLTTFLISTVHTDRLSLSIYLQYKTEIIIIVKRRCLEIICTDPKIFVKYVGVLTVKVVSVLKTVTNSSHVLVLWSSFTSSLFRPP